MPGDRRHCRFGSRRAQVNRMKSQVKLTSPALLLLCCLFFSAFFLFFIRLFACCRARLYECIFFSSTSHLIVSTHSLLKQRSKFWIKLLFRGTLCKNSSGKSSPKNMIVTHKSCWRCESELLFAEPCKPCVETPIEEVVLFVKYVWVTSGITSNCPLCSLIWLRIAL